MMERHPSRRPQLLDVESAKRNWRLAKRLEEHTLVIVPGRASGRVKESWAKVTQAAKSGTKLALKVVRRRLIHVAVVNVRMKEDRIKVTLVHWLLHRANHSMTFSKQH
jgi:hypothetical protein